MSIDIVIIKCLRYMILDFFLNIVINLPTYFSLKNFHVLSLALKYIQILFLIVNYIYSLGWKKNYCVEDTWC